MYLVITPAAEVITQAFKIDTAYRMCLARISVWVYLNDIGDADEISFKLRNETGNFLVVQKVLTGAEIKAAINATNNYAHGKLFLDFDDDVLIGRGSYSLTVEQTVGFTVTNFLALCRDWESPYFLTEETPGGDWAEPYYIRLYDQEGRDLQ